MTMMNMNISQETTHIPRNYNLYKWQLSDCAKNNSHLSLQSLKEASPKKNIYTVCTLWPGSGFPGKSACFPSATAVPVLLNLPLLLRQVPGLFQDALRCDALLLQVLPLPTGPGNDAGPELLGLVMKNTWYRWYGWDGNINGNISGNISGNIIEHKNGNILYIYGNINGNNCWDYGERWNDHLIGFTCPNL